MLFLWACNDCFGDHLHGCCHGSLRSKHHDSLRDIIYHALLVDKEGARLSNVVVQTPIAVLEISFIQVLLMDDQVI